MYNAKVDVVIDIVMNPCIGPQEVQIISHTRLLLLTSYAENLENRTLANSLDHDEMPHLIAVYTVYYYNNHSANIKQII